MTLLSGLSTDFIGLSPGAALEGDGAASRRLGATGRGLPGNRVGRVARLGRGTGLEPGGLQLVDRAQPVLPDHVRHGGAAAATAAALLDVRREPARAGYRRVPGRGDRLVNQGFLVG